MNRVPLLAAIPALAIVLTSCDDWGDWGPSDRYKEDFQSSSPVTAGARLNIENSNGSVEIIGHSENRVDVTGTKYASSDAVLKNIKIDLQATPDGVRLRTIAPSGIRANWGARYIVHVPHKMQLERIISSNGPIKVTDVTGSARLRTSNGAIRLLNFNGSAEVETSNAPVEASNHEGSLIARTSNGHVRADNVRGLFEATTSNSSINARLSDPVPGKPIKLQSSNGSVTLEMPSLKENDVSIHTSNSSITLRLPPSAKGLLKAHTSNSNITTDFDITVRSGQLNKANVEGELNGGIAPVFNLTTSNGGIRVTKF